MTGIEEDYPVLAQFATNFKCSGADDNHRLECFVALEAERALSELQNLRTDVANFLTWKAEASAVLEEWERVWELLDRPGPLGASKASIVYREVAAMRGRPAGRS